MKKKLVKAMVGVLVGSCMFGTVCHAKSNTYPETLVVIGCSDDGFIGIQKDGYVEYSVDWDGDWKLGDNVDVIMNDRGTYKESDDFVVEIVDHRRDAEAGKQMLLSKAKDTIGRAGINIRESLRTSPVLNRLKMKF